MENNKISDFKSIDEIEESKLYSILENISTKVIVQAINDYAFYGREDDTSEEIEWYLDAKEWLFNNDENIKDNSLYYYSTILGIDPSFPRQLAKLKRKHVTEGKISRPNTERSNVETKQTDIFDLLYGI